MQSLNISFLGRAKYRPDHHRACTQRDSFGTEYTHLARAALAVDGQVWSNSRGVLLDAVLLVFSGGVVVVCITLAYHGSCGGRPMIVPRFVFRFYFSPCFMCLAFCCVCLVTYLVYVHHALLSCNPPSAFFRVTIWSNKKTWEKISGLYFRKTLTARHRPQWTFTTLRQGLITASFRRCS